MLDEQLVDSVQRGEDEAFHEIVRRWDRKIFALCFGMLGREAEARDATQEAFIAAYKNLAKFRAEAKFSSWLHRIAVNQCLTLMRKEKSRSENFLDDESGEADSIFVVSEQLSPSRTAEQQERTKIVRKAVVSLPLDLRQVVVMKEFEEMTFQEISDTLNLPLSTVKSRLYTALKQLRLKLSQTAIEVE